MGNTLVSIGLAALEWVHTSIGLSGLKKGTKRLCWDTPRLQQHQRKHRRLHFHHRQIPLHQPHRRQLHHHPDPPTLLQRHRLRPHPATIHIRLQLASSADATIASIKHNLSSHSIREEREKGEEREKEEEKVTVAIAATATTIATVNNRSSIDFKCRCNHPEHRTQPLSSLRSERRREERRRPSSPSLQPPLPPSPPPSSPSTTDPASPNADATTASIELNPKAAFDQREKEREKGGEDHRRHRYNRHYHRHRHHRQQHIQHRADVNIATNLMDLMVVLKPTDVGGDGSDVDSKDGGDNPDDDDGLTLPSFFPTFFFLVSVEYGLCEMMNKKAICLDVAPKDGNWGLGISESEAMLPAEAVDTNVERMYKELPKWEEPFLQARARYQQIFKDLANKYIAENLLLVTHGEGVDVALSSLKKEATVYEVQYCAYVELRRPVFEKDETFTTGEFDVFSNSGETGISYRGGS
ncbi:hypothetical protein RIF29_29896 [Crotalaria pallida]|uniref:Uncharacterized protein n=1 Tax=Crotalaria pallida TaxID=3830 RepID=A0AAN9EFQ3_CROPI